MLFTFCELHRNFGIYSDINQSRFQHNYYFRKNYFCFYIYRIHIILESFLYFCFQNYPFPQFPFLRFLSDTVEVIASYQLLLDFPFPTRCQEVFFYPSFFLKSVLRFVGKEVGLEEFSGLFEAV